MSEVRIHNEFMRASLDAFNQASLREQRKLENKIKAMPILQDSLLPRFKLELKNRFHCSATVSPRAKP